MFPFLDLKQETQGVAGATGQTPGLVLVLLADHRRLITLINEMVHSAREENFSEVGFHLKALKTALNDHLLMESITFYGHLESKLPENSINRRILKEFHGEMDEIASRMMDFISKYLAAPLENRHVPIFLAELLLVSNALADHITREERILYPLYYQYSSDGSTSLP